MIQRFLHLSKISLRHAWKPFCITSLYLVLTGCATTSSAPAPQFAYAKLNINAPALTYQNGLWLSQIPQGDSSTGLTFEQKDVHTKDGVFVLAAPENALVIDLQGAFMIHPFGEVPNHSVDSNWTAETLRAYLRKGVFFYKNTNSRTPFRGNLRSYLKRPDTLDVSLPNGGVSLTGNHLESGNFHTQDANGVLSEVFIEIPTVTVLQEKWRTILQGKPDFIKLYLQNHDKVDSQGLSEAVFRAAVKLANSEDLATTVHLESVADLELALDAGANQFAHLHSLVENKEFLSDDVIAEELIDKMVAQQFATITTVDLTATQYREHPEQLAQIQSLQKKNLRRLFNAGAPIAIGTSNVGSTFETEVAALRSLEIFSDQELLQLLMNTPKVSIFPKRAIASFATGHEASFLGLKCNPFENFNCINSITYRVKQGIDLNAIIGE